MTDDLADCPNCKYPRALTHYSSGDEVNWIACPKCKKFFDHGIEEPIDEHESPDFWKNVEEDTGFVREAW